MVKKGTNTSIGILKWNVLKAWDIKDTNTLT